jgi:hypothetical protein
MTTSHSLPSQDPTKRGGDDVNSQNYKRNVTMERRELRTID